ncbi:MAG: hypothetical protein H7296_09035 [Bacteroidia bacterium]|nr:hypothetical protein [Bacteroidia bacterium]
MNKRFLTIVALIFTAALLRLLPHSPNFSPIGAIALFGGAFLTNRFYSFIIPIAALLVSDFLLGFYGWEMLITYGSFTISILIGNLLRKNKSWERVLFASLSSSMVFFLITNFVYLYPVSIAPMYTKDMAGVFNSYIAGLAFFQNTVVSDLFYSSVLFGGYYLLSINVLALNKNKPALKAEKIIA